MTQKNFQINYIDFLTKECYNDLVINTVTSSGSREEQLEMIDILRKPDDIRITCDGENTDVVVETELHDRKLELYVTATESKPKFICLRWNYRTTEPTRVLGDTWERSYGNLEWRSLNGEHFMPWYFIAFNGKDTTGCGVMVRPNSFVSFEYDPSGVTAWVDVRCGGVGVELKGRKLLAATFVCEHYDDTPAFKAACEFCKVMSPEPRLPKEPVYGSNNWYYAYGKSSYDEIMTDAKIIAELAGSNKNKPFMVIDDGWSVNSCEGPWLPNERYGDMKKVADDFKAMEVKPGIWFRPLHDREARQQHPEWLIKRTVGNNACPFLDPSNPEVAEYLRENIRRIVGWGYELIKHDFTTVDLFGKYGFMLNGTVTDFDNWAFFDRSKTSAEITLDLYRLIREEAGDCIIIGCNTVSHLCAGLVELARTGDDTSGKTWSRTRAYGVNTLAFRLCQNKAFYMADADCVGILEDRIDWKLNRQWADLVAKSGTPLFVSIQPEVLTDEMKKDLAEAFRRNSEQADVAEPLDWLYNKSPQTWLINGETVDYDFVMDSYPVLLKGGEPQPN